MIYKNEERRNRLFGENIYLEAVSMGLGICGVGAFFDDEINKIIGVDGEQETALYMTCIGRLP